MYHGDLIQLCSAEELIVLDQEDVHTIIRFAPASNETASAAVVRTSSLRMAGVLRLVPLRSGSVAFSESTLNLAA